MPRNVNGVYTLPESPFVNGTIIESSVVNSDLSDIASALTGSLATTGVSFMTAPLEGFNTGGVTNPSFKFGSALGIGFFSSSGQLAVSISSVQIGEFAVSATTTWTKPHYFADNIIFLSNININGGISASVTITGDLIVTKGANIGFSATVTEDIIKLADERNYLDGSSTDLSIALFDTNDFIFYDRSDNKFTYEINNSIIKTIDTTTAFYSGLYRLQEIAAPGSASASQANLYIKDNSGTTRAAYKDEQGVETFMGGPGQWELAVESNITTSVGSVTLSWSKIYSRLVVNFMRLVSKSGTGYIHANISDDGGVTLASCRSCIVGLGSFGADVIATANLAVLPVVNAPTMEARLEINRADKVGPKQFKSQASRVNDDFGAFNTGQSASCSAVNAIVIANSVTFMSTGLIQVYGLLAV